MHKHSVMVGAVDAHQSIVLQPRRVTMDDFASWAHEQLKADDVVVLEASANGWELHDLLKPLVAEVVVVHPNHVKVIANSSVKTDKRDTLALARLQAAGLLSSIWVPTHAVRELRALMTHRRRLVKQRVAARNRLHAVLHSHNLKPPEGDPFQLAHRAWWDNLPLSPTIRLRVRHDLMDKLKRSRLTVFDTARELDGEFRRLLIVLSIILLDQADVLIRETEAELAQLSMTHPWAQQLPFVMQLPGIGLLTAMTVISAIGDIRRFPGPKELVGYSGVDASPKRDGASYARPGRSRLGCGASSRILATTVSSTCGTHRQCQGHCSYCPQTAYDHLACAQQARAGSSCRLARRGA
jgi:transposase